MAKSTQTTIFYILFGMFLFSSLGSVVMRKLGLSFSFPELFLALFLLWDKKAGRPFAISSRWGQYLFFTWLVLLLLALLLQRYGLYAILSTARGWFLIFFMIAYTAERERISWDHWIILSIGSLLGWLICAVISYFEKTGSVLSIVYGVSLAIPVVLIGSILNKKPYQMIIALVLVLAICFFSGMRRPLVFLAFTIFISLYYGIKKFGFGRSLIVAGALFVLCWIFIPPLLEKMQQSHSLIYYRVVTRTQKALSGDEGLTPGDTLRVNMLKRALKGEDATWFPQGFVSKQTLTDIGTGKFLDMPLFEITQTYGLILGWGMIVCFLFLFLHLVNRSNPEAKTLGYLGFAMCIALFLDGYFITAPFSCIYTGICIGSMFRMKHTNLRHTLETP